MSLFVLLTGQRTGELVFIGLPAGSITGKKDVTDYLAIIEEHKRCLAPWMKTKGRTLVIRAVPFISFIRQFILFLILRIMGHT